MSARINGGMARARALSPQRRSEIAKAGAAARWGSGGVVARVDAKRMAALRAAKKRVVMQIRALGDELLRIDAALKERADV